MTVPEKLESDSINTTGTCVAYYGNHLLLNDDSPYLIQERINEDPILPSMAMDGQLDMEAFLYNNMCGSAPGPQQ
jgi:hypothetical protein